MRYRPSSHVDFTRVEGDFVLMDLRSGLYFALDPAASRIWEILAEGGGSEAAVERILADFDVEESRARRDVMELIAELTGKDLLVEESE